MNILLDLDGTILDFHKGEANALRKTLIKYLNYEATDLDVSYFRKINEELFLNFSEGKMKRIDFQNRRFELMFKYLNKEGDFINANLYYIDKLQYEANLYDDSIDALNYLFKNHKIFIASNGQAFVQYGRIKEANIEKFITKIYISENLGFNKPNVNFYNEIFKDLNDYNLNNYIMIGDRLDSDILGAKNANIKSIYLNRKGDFSNSFATYNIKTLKELENIL